MIQSCTCVYAVDLPAGVARLSFLAVIDVILVIRTFRNGALDDTYLDWTHECYHHVGEGKWDLGHCLQSLFDCV